MKLSICIATLNRAAFIGETLDSILPQLSAEVELMVVDGASTDGTPAVMATYLERHPQLVYRREDSNSGVDRDFDKAVGYARGDYCWLLSDDDILEPDAVATVLAALADRPAVVLVNAQVRSKDMSVQLHPALLDVAGDLEFGDDEKEQERLLAITGSYLSFIGAVVVRRDAWLAREREAYFGSLFIHMGVLFQPPSIGRVRVIARPLIRIRYGNAMWTARGFEVWIDKWPAIVWSFAHFSAGTRARVTSRHPAKSLKILLHYRAIGAYGPAEYASLLAGGKRPHHPMARLVAAFPAQTANAAVALYCLARRHAPARMMVHDLARAKCASALTRWVARRFRLPEMEK